MDGILSVERIARIISKSNPDVVVLQELDVGRKFKGVNQAAAIAQELEMHFHFHPVCGDEMPCFGNAIFSRYPMKIIRAEHLPMLAKSTFLEPRGVLWVNINFQGHDIHVLNTHLSLWGPELQLQIQKLLGPDLLGSSDLGENVILCGDFNLTPESKFYSMITRHFKEPRFHNDSKASRNTWSSQWPIRRLDHIFVKGHFEAELIVLPKTWLERCASDHLPIAADFEFKIA
jgi:endonuclease/exonuclease/phosphatase family metal-dependent hydrolase